MADIGIPRQLLAATGDDILLIDSDEVRHLLAARPVAGHKGTFGHLLVVAGSLGKSRGGGDDRRGRIAYRCRSGYRRLPGAGCKQVLAVKLTEAMTVPLPEVDGAFAASAFEQLPSLWSGKQALALGPGLGQTAALLPLPCDYPRCPLPLVLDADGFNALAGDMSRCCTGARRQRF